ncbi:MAG: hypothetical protein A2Y82_01170 [Candidatus Buchananbacteria bacterium RBG_13_36_9]|uniref:Uncharacterized protein n=1 Tax=Candidatus Buchananbacteria bacterium RBG_13_36_9 TaxID=1797530 RepID=A0A1G1XNT5_9BACT|nr:MAG: hypothetical protein A2Y82_01170 [Candidatus Buchananbacteria bacterium RBG_13_36_9]
MNEDRKNIINVITSPLGFFALSLLIVEGFLGIILIFSYERDLNFHFWGMILGATLFILVVVGVWVIVWFKPKHLTLEGKHYYDLEKERIKFEESPMNLTEKNIQEQISKYLH